MYYRYPDLKIGWFYGNEQEDYAVYAAEIIQKAARELQIPDANIILYASSAGGTTAIRAGAAIPGCTVVAINPQLDIAKYPGSVSFTKVTHYDLEAEDALRRNALDQIVSGAPQTEFMLIINAESRGDIEIQLQNFCESLGMPLPRYGLAQYQNVKTWIYDGQGKEPHNVQENYHIYCYIRRILPSIRDTDFAVKHQREVLYINDWWQENAKDKQLITSLTEENKRLKKERDTLLRRHCNGEQRTVRFDILHTAEDSAGIELLEISDQAADIQFPSWMNEQGCGCLLQSERGWIKIVFKCSGAGDVSIVLRGINKKDKSGKRIPIWINLERLWINDQIVNDRPVSIWHDRPYRISRSVRDGEIIRLRASWTPRI